MPNLMATALLRSSAPASRKNRPASFNFVTSGKQAQLGT